MHFKKQSQRPSPEPLTLRGARTAIVPRVAQRHAVAGGHQARGACDSGPRGIDPDRSVGQSRKSITDGPSQRPAACTELECRSYRVAYDWQDGGGYSPRPHGQSQTKARVIPGGLCAVRRRALLRIPDTSIKALKRPFACGIADIVIIYHSYSGIKIDDKQHTGERTCDVRRLKGYFWSETCHWIRHHVRPSYPI